MIVFLGLLITPLLGDYQFPGNVTVYQKSESCATQFECVANTQQVDFNIGEREGKFFPARRELLVRLHGQGKAPEAVLVNQERIGTTAWQYLGEQGVVEVQL